MGHATTPQRCRVAYGARHPHPGAYPALMSPTDDATPQTREPSAAPRRPDRAQTGARPDLDPGAPVPVRWTKWPGTEHWEHECVWLGSDEHGDWLGQRPGSRSWRPGRDYLAQTPNVVLVPASGDWAATFYGPGHAAGMEVYIDLGRSVGWATSGPATVVGVDMDLDVVRDTVRGTWIDDEDELEEHAALWRYPEAAVAHLRAVAETLREVVETRTPPFDSQTPARWLTLLGSTGAP